MAHGRWTEIEARGVLEAWKKSGHPPRNIDGLLPGAWAAARDDE